MKKLSVTLLLIITLLGGSFFIAPMLIPKEVVAEKVKSKVKDLTGRDITFQDVNVTFWPNIGLELSDVKLSNPEWSEARYLVGVSKLNVSIAVKPLLEKRIEIKNFSMLYPVIHLEVSSDGKQNWVFDKVKEVKQENKTDSSVSNFSKDLSNGVNFKFGKIQVKNGQLNFFNHKTLAREGISSVNANIDWPDLNSSLKLKGGLRYNKKHLDVDVSLLKPLNFIKGMSSSGNAVLKTEGLLFKANGMFAPAGEFLKGTVKTEINSLPNLISWLSGSSAKSYKDIPFEKVSFDSSLAASATDLILKNANLKLDDISAKGNLSLDISGKPDIFARMSVSKLNLDRFAGVNEPKGRAAIDVKPFIEPKFKDWDNTAIDLSKLKVANLDLSLKAEGFSLKGVNVGPSNLTVVLKNGNLDFKSSKANLFGGSFTSGLNVNAYSKTPTMAFNFDMSGVEAKPVLKTFAGFEKLSGFADAKVSVTSSGKSQKDIVSNLKGKGSAVFKNGAFEGIDLVRISQLIQSNTTQMSVGEGKTEFVELGGDFSIDKGIVKNNNLKMSGPLVKAAGRGLVDLPKKYIKYRVTPVLVSQTTDAEGAAIEKEGLSIPVDIKGRFDRIKVVPDFKSVIKDSISDPNKAKANMKDIRSKVKNLRENIKKDPAKALESIFGGGLFVNPQ